MKFKSSKEIEFENYKKLSKEKQEEYVFKFGPLYTDNFPTNTTRYVPELFTITLLIMLTHFVFFIAGAVVPYYTESLINTTRLLNEATILLQLVSRLYIVIVILICIQVFGTALNICVITYKKKKFFKENKVK
jgi:Na+/melibiose symporter-like transporter